MKDIKDLQGFIDWLNEIEMSLEEETIDTDELNRPGGIEPADTPEDDTQLVQDLALTLVNNTLVKYIRADRLPSESEAHVLVLLHRIARASFDAT